MQFPTEITFHELDRSEALEAVVLRWVERCSQVNDRIDKCEVIIHQPHRHHLHGRAYHITIRMSVPGKDVAVSHIGHEDPYAAVADAFRAARRQADSRVARMRRMRERRSYARPVL